MVQVGNVLGAGICVFSVTSKFGASDIVMLGKRKHDTSRSIEFKLSCRVIAVADQNSHIRTRITALLLDGEEYFIIV
jgi:hypothetical protein